MTSRRSVQPYEQRVSRSLQFRPGHVSGRVASAQPIVPQRVRIGVGATSMPPPDPPTSARVVYATTPTLGMADGAASTVAFCATRARRDINVPSGWILLAEGYGGATNSDGGPIGWAVLAAYNTAMAYSGAYSWATATADRHNGYRYTQSHHFFGGGSGTWRLTVGPMYSSTNAATYTPPGGGRPFIQFGACSNSYAGSPVGLPAGHFLQVGPLAQFGLTGDTYTGATFTDLFITGPPHAGTFTRPTIGAYGAPNSIAFAAEWS